MPRSLCPMGQGAWEEGRSGCPRGYHVLKAVPVLQLVPQKAGDGALLALGQGPHLQTLAPQGHTKEDPKIVQPGESPGHDGVLCPQRAEAVSPAVCASTEARVRPTWPQVSEGGLMSGKGWPRGSSWQVLLGSTHPYLPGSAEGSPGAAAASPMAARTWPETAATGSSLSSRRRESPAGPSESGAGLCFL